MCRTASTCGTAILGCNILASCLNRHRPQAFQGNSLPAFRVYICKKRASLFYFEITTDALLLCTVQFSSRSRILVCGEHLGLRSLQMGRPNDCRKSGRKLITLQVHEKMSVQAVIECNLNTNLLCLESSYRLWARWA